MEPLVLRTKLEKGQGWLFLCPNQKVLMPMAFSPILDGREYTLADDE
jgi:hypothetical protein